MCLFSAVTESSVEYIMEEALGLNLRELCFKIHSNSDIHEDTRFLLQESVCRKNEKEGISCIPQIQWEFCVCKDLVTGVKHTKVCCDFSQLHTYNFSSVWLRLLANCPTLY